MDPLEFQTFAVLAPPQKVLPMVVAAQMKAVLRYKQRVPPDQENNHCSAREKMALKVGRKNSGHSFVAEQKEDYWKDFVPEEVASKVMK